MWANTRSKFTAYIKHLEMVAHGLPPDNPAVVFAREKGIVRVEVRVNRRLLADLGLRDVHEVTHEKLEEVYRERTAVMREVERTDIQDALASLPARTRTFAMLWLAGHDLSDFCNRSQLYVHARRCRELGWEIMEKRNISVMPVRVRVIDLQPVTPPQWYDLKEDAA